MTTNVWPVNVDTSWLPKESAKECKLDVSDTKEDSAPTAFPTSDSREMTVKLKDALIWTTLSVQDAQKSTSSTTTAVWWRTVSPGKTVPVKPVFQDLIWNKAVAL